MALGAKQMASAVWGRTGNLTQLQSVDVIFIDVILSLKVEAWQHLLYDVIWKASSVLPESTCHKHKCAMGLQPEAKHDQLPEAAKEVWGETGIMTPMVEAWEMQ
jgi:hypothetical protein